MRRKTSTRALATLTCGVVTVLSLCLGACRASAPPAGARTATPNSTGTPHAQGTTSATPGTGPSSGPVTVAVDRSRYPSGAAVTVTIHNGQSAPVYALDNHSDCTVVELERWVNGAWVGEASCVNQQPRPHVVTIEAGGVLSEMVPGVNNLTGDPWPAGTYRASFAYATSPDQAIGQGSIAYSGSFVVG